MAEDFDKRNTDEGYEDVCFICRRPESKTGKMFKMPGNMTICMDCMQKTMESVSQMDYQSMWNNPAFFGGMSPFVPPFSKEEEDEQGAEEEDVLTEDEEETSEEDFLEVEIPEEEKPEEKQPKKKTKTPFPNLEGRAKIVFLTCFPAVLSNSRYSPLLGVI